jgi:parallel beta-helix repeat protein
MNRLTPFRRAVVPAALVALAGAVVFAGPLNPPAGPVAPSYKTLTEVEPRTAINSTNTPSGGSSAVYAITQPGSYYLTENLVVPTGSTGIWVNADYVTIDLNGFSIIGAQGSVMGISSFGSNPVNPVIKNGTVTSCGSDGINLAGSPGAKILDVTAIGNHDKGIVVGTNSLLRNCVVTNSAGVGYFSAGYSTFDHCKASGNATGFNLQTGGDVLESCGAVSNTGVGINATNHVRIVNCVVSSNTTQGIACGSDSQIMGCQVYDNGSGGAAGIWAQGSYNRIEGNDCLSNGFGIYVGGANNFIFRNTVGASSQTNFHIAATNHVGTIISAGVNGALINGSSGGGMGTAETDPYANLVY